MGCGSSTAASSAADPLAGAEAVQPAAPATAAAPVPATAAVTAAPSNDNDNAQKDAQQVGSNPAAQATSTPGATAAATKDDQSSSSDDAGASEGEATTLSEADAKSAAELKAADRDAAAAYDVCPTLDAIPNLKFDESLDAIAGDYFGESELDRLVEYISSSPGAADADTDAAGGCSLFEGAASTLEIAPHALVDLVLLCGSIDATIRTLRYFDERAGMRFTSVSELPEAIALHQRAEVQAQCSMAQLSKEMTQSVMAAYSILSKPSCILFPYAMLPPTQPAAAAAATKEGGADSDNSGGGGAETDAQLDFMRINTALIGARTRLRFLSPAFLVALCHAAGFNPAAKQKKDSYNARLILQHLALNEVIFEFPSHLLRAVLLHRAMSEAQQQSLRAIASAGAAAPSAAPAEVQPLFPPVQQLLLPLRVSCNKLDPLIDPLYPTLTQQLSPPLQHLSAYLGRFLPLLLESSGAARESNTPPELHAATSQILHAYLVPFLRLLQPWLLQVRPYLASLQAFFEELQPLLQRAHAFFNASATMMQALAKQIEKQGGEEQEGGGDGQREAAASAILTRGSACFAPLLDTVDVLLDLYPLLQQLDPLLAALLDFNREVDEALLGQMEKMFEVLEPYMPPASASASSSASSASDGAEKEKEKEQSKSSITAPWFPDEENEEGAAAAASSISSSESAVAFLASHARVLRSLQRHVRSLRPFVRDVRAFVDKFVPFVGQLSPFYSSSLKPLVTPLLFYLLPVRVDDADVGTKTPPAKETAGAAETASATAPAHPLNAQ